MKNAVALEQGLAWQATLATALWLMAAIVIGASPVLMTVLLLKVSGVALQKKDIAERRPALPRIHRPYEWLFPPQGTSDKPSKPEHMIACRISARVNQLQMV